MDARDIAKVEQEPLEPDRLATEGAWRPETIRDVEWCLECVAESEAEVAAIEAQLADVKLRAEARAERLMENAKRRAVYFEGRAAEFAEANREDFLVGKKKSRDFLSGRIGWRKKGGKLKVEDKDALAAWLTTQDAKFYRVKVEPEMSELQAHAKATGEVPPGTAWEEEHDEIYIEAVPLMLPKGTP